jgi:hypothetical protein
MKDGRDCMVHLSAPRNVRHHKLYWALIRFIREHTDQFAGHDDEIIHTSLKLATGYVKTFIDTETGKAVMVPRSIAFESMDQARFAKFFDAAVAAICWRWLPPGTVPDDVRREVEAMCDGARQQQRRAG